MAGNFKSGEGGAVGLVGAGSEVGAVGVAEAVGVARAVGNGGAGGGNVDLMRKREEYILSPDMDSMVKRDLEMFVGGLMPNGLRRGVVDVWDPEFQAKLPLYRFYLGASVDEWYTSNYYENIEAVRFDFEPCKALFTRLYNDITIMSRTTEAECLVGVDFVEIAEFMDKADFVIANFKDIKKCSLNMPEALNTMDKLLEGNWSDFMTAVYFYLHSAGNFFIGRYDLIEAIDKRLKQWKSEYLKHFDRVAREVPEAYYWYCDTTRGVLDRLWDIVLDVSKYEDVMPLSVVRNNDEVLINMLTYYIHGTPMMFTSNNYDATVWSTLEANAWPTKRTTVRDKSYIYSVSARKWDGLFNRVCWFYELVANNELVPRLRILKSAELRDIANKKVDSALVEEMLDEYMEDLYDRGFPREGQDSIRFIDSILRSGRAVAVEDDEVDEVDVGEEVEEDVEGDAGGGVGEDVRKDVREGVGEGVQGDKDIKNNMQIVNSNIGGVIVRGSNVEKIEDANGCESDSGSGVGGYYVPDLITIKGSSGVNRSDSGDKSVDDIVNRVLARISNVDEICADSDSGLIEDCVQALRVLKLELGDLDKKRSGIIKDMEKLYDVIGDDIVID